MLRKLIALWVLCGVAMGVQAPAVADDLTDVDEIIAKNIEAQGGRKKLDAIKTIKMTGKNMVGGGMELPISLEIKSPDKIRVDFTFQGMTGTQAYDGKIGWFVMPFMGRTEPEKMPPDQVEAVQEQADFMGPLVDYKKKGHQVELVGKDEVEGSEAYKLKVTKKNGDVEYHFLDAEYFLTIQTKGKREFQGTEMEYEVSYSDFKEVGGVIFPHSINQGAMMGTMVIEKIEINSAISDERFAMPEPKKEEEKEKDEAEVKSEEKTGEDDK